MAWISELMQCDACDSTYGDLIDRSTRDELQQCLTCGEVAAHRIQAIPHVSTSKTSESIPDVLPKRFNKLRRQQELKKELFKAKQKVDRTDEDKVRKELKTLNK